MRRLRKPNSRSTSSRHGFTLLELLIALGLGVLLISSIGASLFLSMQTEQAGREKIERAQIERAIFFKISNDLRSVVYRDLIQESTDDEDVTAAEDDEQLSVSEEPVIFLSPDEAYGSTTVGLYGDTEKLVLNISRPRRPLPVVASASADESEEEILIPDDPYAGSGLRTVSWFLSSSSSEDAPDGGLSRTEGDTTRVMYDPEGFELNALASDAPILAPEVVSLAFRYFDGIDWVEEWDSTALERLPSAVEVTLGLQEPQNKSNQYLDTDDSESSRTLRFVVALPLAPPPLTEVEL